jgi:SAM dependent carboxyl methyltransferase
MVPARPVSYLMCFAPTGGEGRLHRDGAGFESLRAVRLAVPQWRIPNSRFVALPDMSDYGCMPRSTYVALDPMELANAHLSFRVLFGVFEDDMPDEHRPTDSVMEGRGAYNKHAKLPAGGAAFAMPYLKNAVANLSLDASVRPVVVADYGSSQGKNSLAPMQMAIAALRLRIGEERPIQVFHIDQASNDFNSLFAVLAHDADRYAQDEPNVFPCAIGRTFYENVLPPGSVHLGWSSYAAVWLSRVPCRIPGHFISMCSSGAVRTEFERQAAEDWRTFLSLRAVELAPGARLVVVLPALGDDGVSGFEAIMSEERAEMTIGPHPRRTRDLLAPFADGGQFEGLIVEICEMSTLEDTAWHVLERDGDKEGFAAKHALFFRSVFMPSLAAALRRVREGDERALIEFGDRLERGMKDRITLDPNPMHSLVQTIVVAKPG